MRLRWPGRQVPPYDSDGQATDRTSEMMNVALPKERAARTTVVAARQAGWAWTSGGAAALQGAGAEAPARPPPEKSQWLMQGNEPDVTASVRL